MDYKKGDRVKHPTREDWGLGEVLEDNVGKVLRVFFTGVGEKQLSLKYVQPLKVQGKEASDTMLDSLDRRGTEALEEEIRAAQETQSNRPTRPGVTTTADEEDPDTLWDDSAADYDDDDSYDDDFDSDDL